ncbi:MAG: TaqI family restriction endonuclease [Candidatus Portiera sp.]|nr:TaqI family restriction endonuclease [Portiera sp.]
MVRKDEERKLEEFNQFLGQIDLGSYREKYSKIKLVELDMPRNIQAISLLYEYYWDKFELLDYSDFYKVYSESLQGELEDFRNRAMFSKETFYRGLPARIYRTWASLLTQIQGGHLANTMYPKVVMSSELDYSGIDIRIFLYDTSDKYINIQVKKATLSREVRTPWPITKKQAVNYKYYL